MIGARVKESINRATKIGRKFQITEADAREWKLYFCEIYGELKSNIGLIKGTSIKILNNLIEFCENIIKISL
jgi:hypothetical protein